MTTKSSSKPEMAAEIPELIRDPSRANTCYERGRFLGKVKKTRGKNLCQIFDFDIISADFCALFIL